MFTLSSDDSTRTVVYIVKDEDPINLEKRAGRYAGFVPANVTIEFRNGEVDKIAVHGPRRTTSGMHATQWEVWHWPSQRVAKRTPLGETDDVPSVVVQILAHLGYDATGRRI